MFGNLSGTTRNSSLRYFHESEWRLEEGVKARERDSILLFLRPFRNVEADAKFELRSPKVFGFVLFPDLC